MSDQRTPHTALLMTKPTYPIKRRIRCTCFRMVDEQGNDVRWSLCKWHEDRSQADKAVFLRATPLDRGRLIRAIIWSGWETHPAGARDLADAILAALRER